MMKGQSSQAKRLTYERKRYGATRGSIGLPELALASKRQVVLEGVAEVVFIVLAVGAGRGLLVPASIGAIVAFLLVAGVGVIVRRPLARVPENTLKFAVGVMLSAFGVFWTGEGLGIPWPGEDLAIIAFVALFLGTGLAATTLARQPRAEAMS